MDYLLYIAEETLHAAQRAVLVSPQTQHACGIRPVHARWRVQFPVLIWHLLSPLTIDNEVSRTYRSDVGSKMLLFAGDAAIAGARRR
jgi:hypothetical protein